MISSFDKLYDEILTDSEVTTGEELSDEHPEYADTVWQDTMTDGRTVKITMQEVEDELARQKVPTAGVPVYLKRLVDREGTTLDIHTKHKATKTPEEQQKTFNRAMGTNLIFPIIVSKKDGVYNMILDGNHRLHKAMELVRTDHREADDTINVRTLDLSQTPNDWQHVFK